MDVGSYACFEFAEWNGLAALYRAVDIADAEEQTSGFPVDVHRAEVKVGEQCAQAIRAGFGCVPPWMSHAARCHFEERLRRVCALPIKGANVPVTGQEHITFGPSAPPEPV